MSAIRVFQPAGTTGAIQYNAGGELGALPLEWRSGFGGTGLIATGTGHDMEIGSEFGGGVATPSVRDALGNIWRLDQNGLRMAGVPTAWDTGLARTGPGALAVTDGSTGYGRLYAKSLETPENSWGHIGAIGLGYIAPGRLTIPHAGRLEFGADQLNFPDAAIQRTDPGTLKVTDGASGLGSLTAGRVGIGTTDPQYALEVADNIFAHSQIASGNNGFMTYGNGVGRWFGRHLEITGGFPFVLDSTAGIEVTSPWLTTTGDIETTNAACGLILTDRTTGNRWRQYMDNGVQGWELIG